MVSNEFSKVVRHKNWQAAPLGRSRKWSCNKTKTSQCNVTQGKTHISTNTLKSIYHARFDLHLNYGNLVQGEIQIQFNIKLFLRKDID